MKKRTVGIYARYDGSEQSFCAKFLAGYISKCYRYVTWFVPDAPGRGSSCRGFSYQWDPKVQPCSGRRKQAGKAAAQCDTFFFFEPNEELFRRLPAGAVTAFVTDPRYWTPRCRAFAEACTYLLVPGRSRDGQAASVNAKTYFWPFDPSVPGGRRLGIDYEKQPRLLFPAFGFSREERHFAEQVARIVKHCKPDVKTVVTYFDPAIAPRPGNDSRTDDWRLIRYLQNADWIVDLNPRPLYGLFSAFAGTYELQWFGFDTAPNTDPANSARRHLIRQPVENGRVVPDLESTAMRIVRRLNMPFQGDLDRHRGSGVWDHRCTEYLRVTNIVLGIKTKY